MESHYSSCLSGSVGKNLASKTNVYVSSSAGARWREVSFPPLPPAPPPPSCQLGFWFIKDHGRASTFQDHVWPVGRPAAPSVTIKLKESTQSHTRASAALILCSHLVMWARDVARNIPLNQKQTFSCPTTVNLTKCPEGTKQYLSA